MSHFIRKCVLEKEIYQVDLEPFRDLQVLLSNATNNINQIAKRVNQTCIIYKDDIHYMKKVIEHCYAFSNFFFQQFIASSQLRSNPVQSQIVSFPLSIHCFKFHLICISLFTWFEVFSVKI